MKKSRLSTLLMVGAMFCGMVMVSSCDSEQLSRRLAKNALEDSPELGDSCLTATIETGYYEVSESKALELSKLAKAGVITCKLEKIVEKQKRTSYSWYYGSSSYTVDVDHIFAEVELTEEGKKFEVTENHRFRSQIAKLMKVNEPEEKVAEPDYMSLTELVFANDASTKPAAEAKPAKKEEPVEEVVDTAEVEADYADPEPEPAPAPTPSKDEKKSAYELAVEKVNSTSHVVIVGKIDLVDVLDVFCPEEYVKNGKGECKFVIEFTDRNAFGWVLSNETFGKRMMFNADLVHTQDNGWVVSNIGKN